MSNVTDRKLCNALIKEAEVDFALLYTGLSVTGLAGAGKGIEGVLILFRKFYGGLWVGGVAELGEKEFVFKPNLMNRIIHKGDYTIKIPIKEILGVDVKFGFFTKIIDISTA